MKRLTEFGIGLLFGFGLILSGMVSPAKVLGFLDLAGIWDPSLAFVMGGALCVGVIGFGLAKRRGKTLNGNALSLPGTQQVDRRLVIGSLLFGIGWGIAGVCPGPAIVALGQGVAMSWIFIVAMLIGMGLFEYWQRRH